MLCMKQRGIGLLGWGIVLRAYIACRDTVNKEDFGLLEVCQGQFGYINQPCFPWMINV